MVTAALQQAVDGQGEPLFLLKGGTLLQHRLPGLTRTTTDLDGLVRGDLDRFFEVLDDTLRQPWGPCVLHRGPVEQINVPHRLVKPRRFDITVALNGVTWRRVQVETSPDEGLAGSSAERISPPALVGFGLPSPDHLAGLSLRYQIAQKVHASTDPHNPPSSVNDRARDVVDLILLRDLAEATGQPKLTEIRDAIEDIFRARAQEAEATGATPRTWPARLVAHQHWEIDYRSAAASASVPITLADAVDQVNEWFNQLKTA
ncbi:nucleotidyl transferase AbiEii/AbiGii toxin family protein [Tessaracoccus sp. HF-7]|nr:nucleotidyl transferase AbiEii/AbiGii toxin family protein [Tessaracoccus caeni]